MSSPRFVQSLLTALVILTFLLMVVLLPRPARADPRTDCPSAAPCKVITLTAEEEQALFGPRMVFETAVQGRQIDIMPVANYFREKIIKAPAGDAQKPAEKPADAAPAPGVSK